MRRLSLVVPPLLAALLGVVVAARARSADASAAGPADEVIALERAALDRWGKGDPAGFLESPTSTPRPSVALTVAQRSRLTISQSPGRSRSRATR